MIRAICLWTAALLPAAAQHYIRVDSQADGRSYTIDTDKISVQRAMRLVSASDPAARMPEWLYPQPGAQALDARFDPVTGIATATFHCGGTVEQVLDYYAQVLRARSMRISRMPLPGNTGVSLAGATEALAVSIHLTPKNGVVEVKITHTSRHPPITRVFEAVWYDDRNGILRLRDTGTGEEYELPKYAIVNENLNRPGGVRSRDEGKPDWLPVYPGATFPRMKITWLNDPTAQYLTDAPVRKVYEYYIQQVQAAGARLRQTSIQNDGKNDSGRLVALRDDDLVEIEITTVFPLFTGTRTDLHTQTGIGITYKVPQR